MNLLAIAGAVLLAWFLTYLYGFFRLYLAARRSGFPVLLSPINPDQPVYMVIKNSLRPFFERLFPKIIYDRIHLTTYGWEFRTKFEVHSKEGRAFILCTPDHNQLWVADPEVAVAVTTRRKDFLALPITAIVMGVFGSNLITSNGEEWARQRRIVAPNLNERISETVWTESFKQAGEMTEYLLANAQKGTNVTVEGLRVIAVNVLGQAGYGQPKTWSPDLKYDTKDGKDGKDGKMTYFEAIAMVVDYIVPAAVVPLAVMRLPFMPKAFHRLAMALEEAPVLAREMLEKERVNIKASGQTKGNMMSMLIRLGDQEAAKEKDSSTPAGAGHLTEEEIRGNLFIFSAAGFDTTGGTMAYAVTMLAAYPQWQAWLREEMDEVFSKIDNESEPDYNTVFPQLKRCLAVMYETLRHFPPVVHLARGTTAPQTITTSKGTYHIPADTKVYINNTALGCDPEIWGPDVMEYKPTRWLSKDPETGETVLLPPPKGNFMAWSWGPRACPGQKMSQVEFTAVFTKLFRSCKVEPALKEGESLKEGRARLVSLAQDSQPRLTLQMQRPKEVELVWTKR